MVSGKEAVVVLGIFLGFFFNLDFEVSLNAGPPLSPFSDLLELNISPNAAPALLFSSFAFCAFSSLASLIFSLIFSVTEVTDYPFNETEFT